MTSRATDQELLTLQRQYWQAIKDDDAEAVMRLSDDPCVITSPARTASDASIERPSKA